MILGSSSLAHGGPCRVLAPSQARFGTGGMSSDASATPAKQVFRPASLDALNFLLADVRGALGPYLNVFLVTQQHWSQSSVGMMTAISGLVGLAAQTPAGAAIDATRAKRGVIVVALAVLALAALIVFAWPTFGPVLAANTGIAIVGDVFGPAVAALTLGLFAADRLPRQMGRNAAFDHAGNVALAAVAGVVGWWLGQRAVFLLVPVFAALSTIAVLSIPDSAIDHERSRGALRKDSQSDPAGISVLLRCRPLVVFALCLMLFHFANAPLLPLVGQKLAAANPTLATAMMSFCIIAAQLVMLPVSVLSGRQAAQWGRKPVLLAAFAILPVRSVLYTFSNKTEWLIGVQLLDGIGADVLGTLTPLVVADLMRGTGRYNLALGAVATLQGIGASLSGLAAGITVDHFGYSDTFFAAGAAAAAALGVCLFLMPETAPGEREDASIRKHGEAARGPTARTNGSGP
jgi:MFS family permease